jgi:MFS family permease
MDVAAAGPAPLWRQRNFLRFWAAQTVSVFGDQVSLLALPLAAVLTLDASPTQMGVLTALGWLPHLLFSLGAGVWIDRRRQRRRVMVWADLCRAAVLATVPLVSELGHLTIGQLYAVTFLVGTLSVFFDLSYSSAFVSVVPREQVLDANGKLFTTRALSYVAGPSLAGVLVQLLTAPIAILADAISFLVSAIFLRSIDSEEPTVAAETEPVRKRLAEGIRFLVHHPVLLPTLGCVATINFFNFIAWAVIILFASRELDLSAGLIGLAFGAGGVGSVVGALLAPRAGRRFGLGPAYAIGAVLFPAPIALFALAGGPLWLKLSLLIGGEFLSGIGVMLLDVNSNSLSVLLTPHRLRARVVGVHRTVNYGVRPIGALLGGVLGSAIGLRPTLWIGAIGGMLAVLWLIPSPILQVREVAEEPV